MVLHSRRTPAPTTVVVCDFLCPDEARDRALIVALQNLQKHNETPLLLFSNTIENFQQTCLVIFCEHIHYTEQRLWANIIRVRESLCRLWLRLLTAPRQGVVWV
jgi:hypothetical protein